MTPPPTVQQPIAIVGIATQLPSGSDATDNLDSKQFFDFLLNKGEAYERIPLERFNIDSFKGSDAGKVSTEHGTFLKGTDQLDHVELGITNKDAKAMSVSTRKLIELSFLALLDSGIDYRSQNVGCFASGIVFDPLSLSEPDEFEARGSFGGPPAMIANRVSYHLDLVGPSVPVDTACSSSLTATHLAVQAIRSGDCDAAVVGGIQLNHRFVDWVQYSQGGILAPDGKCKPFDATANGFSRGEAGVAIVLKRFDQALEDKDHIYATILGTGINSAGSAAPVNAPVAAAQRDAMHRAWAQTGRDPTEVDFVELHATGTAAGDPAEANWVGQAFHPGREDELLIGSVKGNIGHTEIAAFLASLTKVINVFRTGVIPPNVNLSTPNPRIKWDEYRLRAPTESVALPCRGPSGKSLVALCSSGIGGANGHVVLEAPPVLSANSDRPASQEGPRKPLLLVAGGLSPRSATSISDTIADLVLNHPDREAFLSTIYGRRSRQMTWRSFATYTPGQSAKVKFSLPTLVPRVKPPIIFVFAGQGPQHLDMGRELFSGHPVFRESILEMDEVYRRNTGTSLISSTGLFCNVGAIPVKLGDVWPIDVTLPALAMLQCALVDLLASVGVTPNMVVGHSAGETAVLYASRAGSKEMVVELAIARGKAMALVEESGGTMAAVSCGIYDAQTIIQDALGHELAKSVDVACHNSKEAVTIAGLTTSIDKVVTLAESRGIMARKLRTRVPVHSSMMELCRHEFQSSVEEVWARYPGVHVPEIPVYSTFTGGLLDRPFTSDYFWDGTRGPVLFTEAITSLLENYPTSTFTELSPHPVLSSYLSALGATNVISLLRRPKRNEHTPVEALAFLEGLGRFTALGHNSVDFSALNDHPALDTDFAIPSYPFAPKAISYHSESASFYRPFQGRKGPLNYPGLRVNSQTHPILAQHVIKGEPIMPAAGFLEMALEFGAVVLWDVEFRAMMSLSSDSPMPVEVKLDGIHWTVKTSTASTSSRKNQDVIFDKVHAEGYLSLDASSEEYKSLNLQDIFARCKRINLANFYEDLKTFAEYGPAFQRVIDGYQGENEVLVLVRGPDDLLNVEEYCFHPAIMDCCLHFMVHKSFTLSTDSNIYYLPSKVGRLTVHSEMVDSAFPEHVYAHIVFKTWTPKTIIADFYIVAIDGTRLCTLTQVEVERHESSPRVDIVQRYDVAFQPIALPILAVQEQDLILSGHEDMRQLYQYLDHQAAQVITETLQSQPKVGTELDRKRYMKFSTKVANSVISPQLFNESTILELHRKWPEMMEITNRVSSVHGKILETSKAAVEVLYKDDIMTRFYKHYDWASEACAARFGSLVSSMARSGKKVIRVLEVGAGTGALTRHLANVMAEFPSVVIEFVVSDVSKELLPRVAYPRCRYKSFDLSRPAEDQGFEPASFDVISAFHVLHVVESMSPSLAVLNQLLVPGGHLLIGDLNGDSWTSRAPGSIWFDFVFGSFSEWFAFTDKRSHCTMSAQAWRECLHVADFDHVVTEAFAADPLLFTLEAQKLHQPDLQSGVKRQNALIFRYKRGLEGDLRSKISACDASAPLSVWLFAGSGFEGDAGMGFSRSLGREYALWEVHFVVFDGCWSERSQACFVSELSCTRGLEPVLLVDERGAVSVPRVIPAPNPSGHTPFQPSLPWTSSDAGFTQISSAPRDHGLVQIRVLAMSRPAMKLRAFVGRVSATVDDLAANDLVVGIHPSPDISNIVVANGASLALLPESAENQAAEIAGAALGLVVGSLGCGAAALRSPRRRRHGKALLSHGTSAFGSSLRWFLQLLDFDVIEPKSESPADIAALGGQFDLIISGSDSRVDFQACSRVLSRNGLIFMWNDPSLGLVSLLENDPLAIGEALDVAIELIASRHDLPLDTKGVRMTEISLPETGTLVSSATSLFDPSKAYILVGGIGGLGIRIALWMYERGARYLVLTSRSGQESLARVQDRLALRIVTYLQSMPDLVFRLEASDATSCVSTTSLFRSIPVQLGGCMLLSVVLSDRTFAFQDDNDFNKVFASKTGACNVLASCIPDGISSLDFFVTFSSVVGLFGNGGQTNYSSANTALDGMTRRWDNAFTFVLPAISDGGGLASETREQGGRLGHLTPWGMTAEHICDSLEDGIRKLADGPFWQYIPDLDWSLVQKFMGSSALYGHLVEASSEGGPTLAAEDGTSMLDIILELLDVDSSEFSEDVPFTAYGLDSLSAARLSFALRPFVAISQLQLLSDVSLSDIEARIERAQEAQPREDVESAPSPRPGAEQKVVEMEKLISKYTTAFPKHVSSNDITPGGEVVLITGTTGAIGSSMLAQLAITSSVTRIYALNRVNSDTSLSLRERQAASLEARGYDASILDRENIVLVEGDQSKHDLGIPTQLYQEIQSSITAIIHNAWPVNFTSSLASLEPAVRSVRVMVDLALGSPRQSPARLLFLSSIGLFYNRKSAGFAPEDAITDAKQVVGTGYSESKWVGERILQTAAESTPLRPVIVRAGQICGGPNGNWNATEWFPSLVKSSVHLGCLPSGEGEISWIPLHTAAKSLIEMRNADRRTLHLSHPRPAPWSLVSESLSKSLELPLVSYPEWLARLEKSAGEVGCAPQELGKTSNPALGLLDYFRSLEIGTNAGKEALGLPKLSVVEGSKASPALKGAEPLTRRDVEQWLSNWESSGFLNV